MVTFQSLRSVAIREEVAEGFLRRLVMWRMVERDEGWGLGLGTEEEAAEREDVLPPDVLVDCELLTEEFADDEEDVSVEM